MVFFSVFLRTLGFLSAVLIFLIIINILLYFSNDLQKKHFVMTDGTESSNNIIAKINLNGPIFNNNSNVFGNNLYDYIDPAQVKSYLEELKKLKINTLIININTPGGTVSATAELEQIIYKFKEETNTKVYFFTKEILASGGYWVATTGDKIFANYGSIIGSIGVSGPSWYYYDKPMAISTNIIGQKIETKNGIEIYNQNAGNSKDLYNPFRKPTKNELDHLKNIVTKIYEDFLIKVSDSRKIEINILKNDIGALIYSGSQAKENFLIDDVLDFNELVEMTIKNKNFENYRLVEISSKNNFAIRFFKSYFGIDYNYLCNNLNSNFISVFPIFLNRC